MKKTPGKRSIRSKFSIPIILMSVMLLLAYSVFDYFQNANASRTELTSKADIMVELGAVASIKPLWDLNKQQLEGNIEAMLRDPEVALVEICEGEDKVMLSSSKEGAQYTKGNMIIKEKELIYEDQSIGFIRIGITDYFRKRDLYEKLIFVIVRTLIIILATWLTVLLVTRKVIKPIIDLSKATDSIANGELNNKIEIGTTDEIGELALKFDKMRENLRETVIKNIDTAQTLAASSQELSASVESVRVMTEQLCSASGNIAESTEEQANNINSSVLLLREMNASLEHISTSIQNASSLSDKSKLLAEAGSTAVRDAIEKMSEINENVQYSAGIIKGLSHNTEDIISFLDTIKTITSQLDMLSLNAAIEAARAGENGKGFAVVAGEVKKLAEQSNEAAQQITVIVNNIKESMQNSVLAMDNVTNVVKEDAATISNAGDVLREMQDFTKQISAIIKQIENDTNIQVDGNSSIVRNIEKVSLLAEQTASGAEQSTDAIKSQEQSIIEIMHAAQELSKSAESMLLSISGFKV
ncbi:MAG: methyl-accepting chemotaxis protein [Bacillota bacterium]